ncbi:hypothetical protein CF319_g561 [Tilletia indica]|nr:hypothetical protein CF319_g561 [Tilletia indica]
MPKGARGRPRKLVHAERTTRSSKAKNLQYGLEDPEQAEKQLTAQLKAMGLYAANTLGDGNCLFRALSDQLYGYPNQHLHIRHAICDYLQSHPEKYAGFVDDAKPFDAYVRNMREQGTYGGHLELSAFAHLQRKQIKIVQPNLVYVVAADDEDDQSQHDSRSAGESQASNTGELPPTARQMRRLKRESKDGPALPVDPGSVISASPTASSSASMLASSSTAAAQLPPASSTIPPSPSTASTMSIASPATPSGSRTTPKATPVRTPAVIPVIVEATGPLYIAYHNWEHYSSIRNLDGPHQGLPRIREKPINQADLAKEFSTIAAKAARRGGLPLGKGKAKANTRPGTSSLDADQPSEEEKLVMDSAPGHSLFEIRQLLKLLGSWEDVVEKLVAEDQAEPVIVARPNPKELHRDNKSEPRSSRPSSSRRGDATSNGPVPLEDDVIVITDDEDGLVPSANPMGVPPPVTSQVQAIRSAAMHASSSASNLAHGHVSADVAWRAGSPSSVGTAASARSSASMLTAGTSTSTSTVPTSDDWNAESVSSGLTTVPSSSVNGGADSRKASIDEADGEGGDQYLALSPDSTLTAREMSILEDGRRLAVMNGDGSGSAGGDEAARISPSLFKRKAHQGYDVGADGDDDSDMSHKRFSPARGQFLENGQVQQAVGVPNQPGVIPSSVSPNSSAEPGGSAEIGGDVRLAEQSLTLPSAPRIPGAIAKSGLSRMDAISVGSGSSSDSELPVAHLQVPSELARPGLSSSYSPASSSSSRFSQREDGSALPMLIPPSQRRQRSHLSSGAGSGSGTSTDDDSIATSRPRRTSATPVDYRASALGRSGAPGPGQAPVSLASGVPTQSKRAKRDQKRAEKVERERAKARTRRLGRGLGVPDDQDDEEGTEGEDGQAGVPPAQFAFRELRI